MTHSGRQWLRMSVLALEAMAAGDARQVEMVNEVKGVMAKHLETQRVQDAAELTERQQEAVRIAMQRY